ncbi:heat shock protein [Coprinopsis sp. MPI-PUGE-AT-0042]|nr:heat shock protein [Coprinopsis sp. MPI-PUGE-AT-0042]
MDRPSQRRSPIFSQHRTREQFMAFVASPSLFLFITLSLLLCPIASATTTHTSNYGTVIGIDLGTTHSRVAIYKGDTVEILANDQGNRSTPSWVSFSGDEILVGEPAKNAFHSNPQNTVFDIRRLIGHSLSELDVHQDIKRWPFAVKEQDGKLVVEVEYKGANKTFTPEEISAIVLTKMKETAEAYLGEKVTHAVITVPAYFNDAQRQATKDAGAIAGLEILRVINEPTAAAIAYGIREKDEGETRFLVFDLGAGDTHLGGEDFDNRVVDHLVSTYEAMHSRGAHKGEVKKDVRAMGQLRKAAEGAKKLLSTQMSTNIEIDSFYGGEDLVEVFTRAKFEEPTADLFKKTMKSVEQVMKDAGVEKADIDEIVLVGGSTHIPKVRQMLEEYFGKEPLQRANPEEAVVHGAALHAAILGGTTENENCGCVDITPLTLGIEATGGIFSTLIRRNSILPARKSDNQQAVKIHVYEGERIQTKHNRLIGQFELNGIPPAPKGVPQIEITFELDADMNMTISALDRATGKSTSIQTQNEWGRLSVEDIERMVMEGEQFAEEDEMLRKQVGAVNTLPSPVGDTKGQLLDRAELKSALSEAEGWVSKKEASVEDLEEKLADVDTNERAQMYKDKLTRYWPNCTRSINNDEWTNRDPGDL